MIDCVITQPICESGVALLRSAGLKVFQAPAANLEVMRSPLTTARAVITRNWGFSAEAIAAAPHLRVIGSHGSGIDSIDRNAAQARGVAIVNTPGKNAISVAEHAIGLMLACARSLIAADHAVRRGDHEFRQSQIGFELSGRRLGLVGYGHVARHVALLARAFGMTIYALSDYATREDLARDHVLKKSSLEELLSVSDIVSLHGLPDLTQKLSAPELSLLPKGAILINTARGALLDEHALIDALECGHLSAAGLDVFKQEPMPLDNRLLLAPRLIVSPHIGGSSVQALERTGREVARRVLEALLEAPLQ